MKFLHLSDLHIGKRVNEIPMIEDQKYILSEILKIIEEKVENKDVSIFNACQDLLIAYHASIYPLPIEEDEYDLVAAATYYAALTNYGIDEDIEQVASLFGVKSKFIEIYYENICKLSTF